MDRQRPLIFLTVGTQLPFARLVAALDAYAPRAHERGLEVFGQVLETSRPPRHFEVTSRLSKADFAQRFEAAAIVVSHAGMGTIIGCQMAGKPAILMPRRADLGEHRNDHQLATARAFADRPGIAIATDAAELAQMLDQHRFDAVPTFPRLGPAADTAFLSRLQAIIEAPR